MQFENLFKPGNIGSLKLKNRIVMPPMGTNQASPEGEVTSEMTDYYEARARGGAGLIIIEFTGIDSRLGKMITRHLWANTQPREERPFCFFLSHLPYGSVLSTHPVKSYRKSLF